MCEVHTRIKLTNAFDDHQFRRGKIPRENIRTVTVNALVDENSVRPAIPVALAEKLGLWVSDGISAPIVFELLGRECSGDAIVEGDRVSLGFVVLNQLDLKIDKVNEVQVHFSCLKKQWTS